MNSTTKLSFSTCYYLRKILWKNKDGIKRILSQQSGFCLGCETDLKQLLESVYLEEILEQHLAKLYLKDTKVPAQIQRLEELVKRHQALITSNLIYSNEFFDVERQIFWILGFKRVIVNIEDLVNALNYISQFSVKYLGTILTSKNWQLTRPNFDWLGNFQVHQSADITFSGTITESVSFMQLQWIQEWVTAFTQRGSQVIKDFAAMIEQNQVGKLPEGILLTHINSYSSWLCYSTKLQNVRSLP